MPTTTTASSTPTSTASPERDRTRLDTTDEKVYPVLTAPNVSMSAGPGAGDIPYEYWTEKELRDAGLWNPRNETGEVRVTDPDTGAQKGSKPERFDLIPAGALAQLSRVYGEGARKYDDHNWRGGYAWGLSYAALQRHLTAFWGGEDLDPESGMPHLAHAAWHCFTLLTFMEEHPEKDDRYGRN